MGFGDEANEAEILMRLSTTWVCLTMTNNV